MIACPCDRCRLMFGDEWRGHANRGAERMAHREMETTPERFARALIELVALSCRP